MSSPLIVWAGNRLIKVTENEVKIKSIEQRIERLHTMTWQMHWHQIQSKNIVVPNPPKDR